MPDTYARTSSDEKLLRYGYEIGREIERRGLTDELAARLSESEVERRPWPGEDICPVRSRPDQFNEPMPHLWAAGRCIACGPRPLPGYYRWRDRIRMWWNKR